ncbi:Clp protease N-terminal domain-containing protein [Arthrobacter sp. SX1312]|uniref:SRPBCC family protein n=1 Tax=Arthrobacter sp. SX1312 TaxID=2058896 RepID=UPI000CE31A73|nr:Clp protease N-terminal domain-containing protein [Arthrobacter sp. SX1312]
MSRFTRYATTSQSLSLIAMEEASRRGSREADLEDLFLALVLNDQPAGQVLRELGITVHTARAAVEEHQKDQIASLGISADLPPSGDIVFHETGGYAWSKRASDLIGRAGRKGRTADASAVLRELMNEPSGLIADLLRRLNTTPAAVLTELARNPAMVTTGEEDRAPHRGKLSGVCESFIPAPVEDVWALLSDPARIPEWEPAIGTVESPTNTTDSTAEPTTTAEPGDQRAQVGGVWTAYAQTTHPNGKPLKVSDKFRRRTLELIRADQHTHISWRFTHPDSTTSLPIITSFDLTPTTGGTQLSTAMTWARRRGWRSLLSPGLRPLQRFLIWVRLSQISGSISRTFRRT